MTQFSTVVAPKGHTAPEILYDIWYGLLIHCDVDRFDHLKAMERGWLHNMLSEIGVELPIIATLRIIEQCREDGSLQLPESYQEIWKPRDFDA